MTNGRSCWKNSNNTGDRFIWLVLVLLGIVTLGESSWGQLQQPPPQASPRLRPVIAQSRIDGLLLGLDLQLTFGAWELRAGGAYGLLSQAGRFRTRIQYLQAIGFSYGDWPTSLVLGRSGEQGLHLTIDLIALRRLLGDAEGGLLAEILKQSRLEGTGFLGRLWPGEGETEGPQVGYLHLRGFIHWPLPFGTTFEARGEFLYGQPEATERPFQTFFSSSRVWVDQTSLELRLGELDNPVGLKGFRFDLGLRSYPEAVAGHRFLLASLEQRFELFSGYLGSLDLTSLLGPVLGWFPVHLRMKSSVFFEGGLVLGEGDPLSPDQVLFGWGTALLLPDLGAQVSIAINREGMPVLKVEAGVLP